MEIEEMSKRMAKTEEASKIVKNLQLLCGEDDNLLDVITVNVMNAGMNDKIREIRKEFILKSELKSAELRLVSYVDYQKQKKEMEAKL